MRQKTLEIRVCIRIDCPCKDVCACHVRHIDLIPCGLTTHIVPLIRVDLEDRRKVKDHYFDSIRFNHGFINLVANGFFDRDRGREDDAVNLKGSKTENNLKAAFAGESQANRRYLYFAQKADVEGYNDVAAVFRSTAEGETGHAHGHLEYLEQVGDPATGLPIGPTSDNLKASIAGETHEYTDMYPGMAKTARDEGFHEIADWFETLAKAERSHANRFQKALDALTD